MQYCSYILRTVGRFLYGEVNNEEFLKLTDATWDEKVAVFILIACVAALGVAPFWVSDMISASVESVLSNLVIF